MAEVRQFASRPADPDGQPVPFDVNGERFEARPAGSMPGGFLFDAAEIMGLVQHLGPNPNAATVDLPTLLHLMRLCHRALDEMLLPESATRFADRLRSGDTPIDVFTALEVVTYLIEEVFADRPTMPSSSSPSSPSTDVPQVDGGVVGSTVQPLLPPVALSIG